MSTYIELEIQNLLSENGDGEADLRYIGERLIQSLLSSHEHLTLDNINSLSKFLITSHHPELLIEFILRHLDNESFPIPWPYFLEALGLMAEPPDEKTLRALTEGIQEDNAESESARSQSFNAIPELSEWRSNRKYKIHKDYLNNKNALLEQLITLRTQQLYEQEKNLLARLQKLYPGDSAILGEVREHKQRYALEILQRRSPKKRAVRIQDYTPRDEENEKAMEALLLSLHEHAEQNPAMAIDFAIAAYMWESYDGALSLLSFCEEENESYLWLRLEILLKCRRYVEVLNDLAKVEIMYSGEPETFFATAYLRAQAFWGLGQKHTAIEVLEGLLTSRPHYRAASALLSIWSTQ